MHFLDLTLPDLASNLALDEALLLDAEERGGRETLRVWEWCEPAVILGSGCRLAEDVHEAACQAAGVPILRRASGGGTVLLAKGCLCYSLVLAYSRAPALRGVRSSYRYILEEVRETLDGIVPATGLAGASDLIAGGRKFSGNSQQRKQHFLLHHGTLLYDFSFSLIGRFLPIPSRQPDYRRSRAHEAFLVNLPTSARELACRLRKRWAADKELARWPQQLVQQLAAEKYTNVDWIRRR